MSRHNGKPSSSLPSGSSSTAKTSVATPATYTCSVCGQAKSRDEMARRTIKDWRGRVIAKDQVTAKCKACSNAPIRSWSKAHRERCNENRRWHYLEQQIPDQKTKERIRRKRLLLHRLGEPLDKAFMEEVLDAIYGKK